MLETFASGVIGGAVILALAFSGVSLWLSLKTGSLSHLERQHSQLRLEVTDLVDRVEQWQKRDRVRRTREGKESAELPTASPVEGSTPTPNGLDRAAKMAMLRARRGTNA